MSEFAQNKTMTLNKVIFSLGIVTALALPAFAKAPTKDIVDTAAGNAQFSTLVSLVKAADLVTTLKGKGPFTVFAPVNAAFAKVPKATLDKLGADKALLQGVLTYHVVSGTVLAADVVKMNGKSVKTVNGGTVKIAVRNGSVYINNSKVTTTDIKTTNGVIHVIDSVLMPKAKVKAQSMEVKTETCGSCPTK